MRARCVAEVVSVDAATAFSEMDAVVTFAICAADVATLVPRRAWLDRGHALQNAQSGLLITWMPVTI